MGGGEHSTLNQGHKAGVSLMWFKESGHFAKNEEPESEVFHECSKNQTNRWMMRELGLKAKAPRRYKVTTDTSPVKAGNRLRVPKALPRFLREQDVVALFNTIKGKRDMYVLQA